jgi:hypothetical protein
MIQGFEHVGTDHKCNVCQCDFTDDEGGIQGYFGILPVAFCPTCYASMCDMVGQFDDREWEGLTEEERKEIWNVGEKKDQAVRALLIQTIRNVEAKLKEKNNG